MRAHGRVGDALGARCQSPIGAGRARIAGSPFGSLAEAVASELRRTEDLPRWPEVNDQLPIAKVAAWTPAQTLAVPDAWERLRAVARQGRQTTLAELLRAAGPARDGTRIAD